MSLFTLKNKILKKSIRELNYLKVLWDSGKIKDSKKIMFADVTNLAVNRYLYSFLKYFEIQGYTVYLPKNRKLIDVLNKKSGEFEYASWILKDRFVKFGEPLRKKVTLWLDAEQLSNDYFSDFSTVNSAHSHYHVPSGEFPYFYHKNCWENSAAHKLERKMSVFMIGNCDAKYYHEISKEKHFNLPSRYETAIYLTGKNYYKSLRSVEELNDFLSGSEDSKVILIDTSKDFQIEGLKLKATLPEFYFYLALPGVVIPISHNLIEAMAAGCIPVIHKDYAELLRPKLENRKNCFSYNTLEELDELIRDLFMINIFHIKKMHKEVLKYYKEHLTPKAVVDFIEEKKPKRIFIQAESVSLRYLKNKD